MRNLGSSRSIRLGLVVVVAAAFLVVAAAALSGVAQQQKTIVAVKAGTPTELKFAPASKTVLKSAGPLTVAFTVTNKGKLKHDFKIAGKKTLLIAPGATRTLVVAFAKTGRFQYICTVLGHAAAGMKGTLTVRRA